MGKSYIQVIVRGGIIGSSECDHLSMSDGLLFCVPTLPLGSDVEPWRRANISQREPQEGNRTLIFTEPSFCAVCHIT